MWFVPHRILRGLYYYDRGAVADAQRARALLTEDASRDPDVIDLGPEAPSDETARQRFFGEV